MFFIRRSSAAGTAFLFCMVICSVCIGENVVFVYYHYTTDKKIMYFDEIMTPSGKLAVPARPDLWYDKKEQDKTEYLKGISYEKIHNEGREVFS